MHTVFDISSFSSLTHKHTLLLLSHRAPDKIKHFIVTLTNGTSLYPLPSSHTSPLLPPTTSLLHPFLPLPPLRYRCVSVGGQAFRVRQHFCPDSTPRHPSYVIIGALRSPIDSIYLTSKEDLYLRFVVYHLRSIHHAIYLLPPPPPAHLISLSLSLLAGWHMSTNAVSQSRRRRVGVCRSAPTAHASYSLQLHSPAST